MLSIPSDFWPRFTAEAWGQRPAVWRRPFGGVLADEAEVFAALCELGRRLGAGDERIAFRFHRGGQPDDHPESSLPLPGDGDLAGYARRLTRAQPDVEAGIIVNTFQALHPDIWRRSLDFLGGLHACVGLPPGGTLIDLLTGNYRRSFLDFHKDDQDVFTFVIAGRKRLLAWPFETFRDAAALGDDDRGRSFVMRGFDYRPYREQAVVLEGGAGDLIYWPASHWHVAEGDGETWPVTLTVALIPRGDPMVKLALGAAGAPGRRPVQPFCQPHHPLRPHAGSLGRVLDLAPLQRALDEKVLSFVTRSGYRMLPERRPPEPLANDQRLRLSHPAALAWLEGDGEVLWAACGEVRRAPERDGVAALLGAVAQGEPIRVGDLLGGRRTAEARRALLGDLLHVRAVDRVPR